MKYKIGDKVTRIFEGDRCEVIATKTIPHKAKDENGQLRGDEYFPPDGADYLVVSTDKLKSSDKFSPYYPVTENQLRELKE